MSKQSKYPFQNLTPQAWTNLGLVAVLVFYVALFVLDILWGNMCGHLAIDYCSFWSAGHIANKQGYAAVYNLNIMEEVQRSVFPRRYEAPGTFATVPTPYLPIFILPFSLLSFLGPFWGYWVWTAINFLIFFYYIRYFASKTLGESMNKHLLFLILLSFPVFLNFFYGQVNIWLTIFIGEYMRASISKKPFQSGLWLAGLLLKPQYLIVIGIALLMQKSIKALLGLATASAVLLGISYIMIGYQGFIALIQLWLGYTNGLPATGPNVMMNWRMIGLFLNGFLSSSLVWIPIYAAMVLTTISGLYLWRHKVDPNSSAFSIVILGTFAATCVVTWHSHISSATILICPLMILYQQQRLPKNALVLWATVPALFQLIVIVLAGLNQAGILPGDQSNLLNFLSAVAPFGFNLYFLFWTMREIRKSSSRDFDNNILSEAQIS